jgi:hypothetical protein
MSEKATTFPAYPSVCTICGALFDARAGDHLHGPVALIAGQEAEWTGRRPTYDELALAVRRLAERADPQSGAIRCGVREWHEVLTTVLELGYRLEPGP